VRSLTYLGSHNRAPFVEHRYAFDVVYIVVFVQMTTIISEFFWLILLVVLTGRTPTQSVHLAFLTTSRRADPRVCWLQASRPCARRCTSHTLELPAFIKLRLTPLAR
jgi:hypothetical protein